MGAARRRRRRRQKDPGPDVVDVSVAVKTCISISISISISVPHSCGRTASSSSSQSETELAPHRVHSWEETPPLTSTQRFSQSERSSLTLTRPQQGNKILLNLVNTLLSHALLLLLLLLLRSPGLAVLQGQTGRKKLETQEGRRREGGEEGMTTTLICPSPWLNVS